MEYIIMDKIYGVMDFSNDIECCICKDSKILLYKCKHCKLFYCLKCGDDRIQYHKFKSDYGYYIAYSCCDKCCDKHNGVVCVVCGFKNSNLYMKLNNKNEYMCQSCFK